MQETWVQTLGWEDPLEKGMATHASILPWEIPRTEEAGGLQSTGLQRVGHDGATNTFSFTGVVRSTCSPTPTKHPLFLLRMRVPGTCFRVTTRAPLSGQCCPHPQHQAEGELSVYVTLGAASPSLHNGCWRMGPRCNVVQQEETSGFELKQLGRGRLLHPN